MTNKQANSKVVKLFNKWKKDFSGGLATTNDYYIKRDILTKECKDLHNVIDVYYVLTPLNALKMASMNSSLRFVPPYTMLMQLQKTTNTY